MKFEQIAVAFAVEWKRRLDRDLDGDISVSFASDPDDGPVFHCHGQCRKVHADLVQMYPNGWGFHQTYTFDFVMETLGFTLELEPVNVQNKD